MSSALSGRSLLTLLDFTTDEIIRIVETASELKAEATAGLRRRMFEGKSLALLFEKRSTRTRCAFETAFGEAGGHPVFLSTDDIHLGAKESIEDTARVFGRMFDAVQFRGFKQETAETLARYSGVPVYNGLTDTYHPTQALADLMTINERSGKLAGVKVCYVGDGRNNVARSLMVGCAKTGVHLVMASPAELQPDRDFRSRVEACASDTGATLTITDDAQAAAVDAAAVYTDVWTSMGEEAESAHRRALLEPYQVNRALMECTGSDASFFMHCLPAVKGEEVTTEVIDGPRSAAWDQAENRKHTIKALMKLTLGV